MAPSNNTNKRENFDSIIKGTKTLSLEVSLRVKGGFAEFADRLPINSKSRLLRHGIDLSKGYPERFPTEDIPFYLGQARKIRDKPLSYIVRDPSERSQEVIHLTKHIGTEIVGLQLADLNEQQLDELALLIAERTVVFFKNQDLSPQKQLEIGKFYGNPEVHAQVPFVPGLPGVTVFWPDHFIWEGRKANFKNPGGASCWHTDLFHETQPSGITHLHNDQIPTIGGDTVWSSGYGAYDKLSPAFQKFLESKEAAYASSHTYIDRENPLSGPKHIELIRPIVRTHPVTGWKSLFVNCAMTKEIVGLEPEESKVILEHLFNIYEKNLDLQVRFKWQPTKTGFGTSALWDNRISQHNAVWDYEDGEPRHGTRISSLSEVPFFDPNSKSRREALGLQLKDIFVYFCFYILVSVTRA